MSNKETSLEALESLEADLPNITERVYQHILSKGSQGITDDEGFRALGMNPNTYRPCRVKLYKKGLVLNTNTKGLTDSGRKAWRWKATPKSEAVAPLKVKTRQSKNLPKFNPPILPEGYDVGLREARERMESKLKDADECRCPCCGVNVSK